MANQYLSPSDPVISMLNNEMDSKNVPPQQAEGYLAAQGRQVPGQLAFLMMMNQRLKAAQPQQAPQSTVAQDLQMAMQGQGQMQQPQGPLPPNQTAQFLAQQRAPQPQQQNPMQQGIGQIPQRAVGQPTAYKGGGIVAFNGQDYGSYVSGEEFDPLYLLKSLEKLKPIYEKAKMPAMQLFDNMPSGDPKSRLLDQIRAGDKVVIDRLRTDPGAKRELELLGITSAELTAAMPAVDTPKPPANGFAQAMAPGASRMPLVDKVAEEQAAPEGNPFEDEYLKQLEAIEVPKPADDLEEVTVSTKKMGNFERLAGPAPDEDEYVANRARQRTAAGQDKLDEAQKAELKRLSDALPEEKRQQFWENISRAGFASVGTPTRKRGLAGMLPGLGVAGREFSDRQAASRKEYKDRENLMKKAELELQKAQVAAKMGDYDAYNNHNDKYNDLLLKLRGEDVKEANIRERLGMELSNRRDIAESNNATRAAMALAKDDPNMKAIDRLKIARANVEFLTKVVKDAELTGQDATREIILLARQQQLMLSLQGLLGQEDTDSTAQGQRPSLDSFQR